jgi:hypothetical protein
LLTEGDGGPPVPRAAFAVEQPQLARGGEVEDPSRQDAVGHDVPARGPQPLGIEGTRAADARAQRIFGQAQALWKDLRPKKVARPGRAAGDRRR